MNLTRGTALSTSGDLQSRANSPLVVGAGIHGHAQAWSRSAIMPQRGRRAILRHRQIHSPVAVVIAGGGAAPVAKHGNPGGAYAERTESATTVAEEQQASTGIEARRIEGRRREI